MLSEKVVRNASIHFWGKRKKRAKKKLNSHICSHHQNNKWKNKRLSRKTAKICTCQIENQHTKTWLAYPSPSQTSKKKRRIPKRQRIGMSDFFFGETGALSEEKKIGRINMRMKQKKKRTHFDITDMHIRFLLW